MVALDFPPPAHPPADSGVPYRRAGPCGVSAGLPAKNEQGQDRPRLWHDGGSHAGTDIHSQMPFHNPVGSSDGQVTIGTPEHGVPNGCAIPHSSQVNRYGICGKA